MGAFRRDTCPRMRIPYGKSNFAELRRGGYVYADKTGFIPKLEDATKGRHYLVFLRPRAARSKYCRRAPRRSSGR